MKTSVTSTVDADGVAWIEFDDPNSRANVFNPVTLAALNQAFEDLQEKTKKPGAVKGMVIVSAKERVFIAGADLRWLTELADEAAAWAVARSGQTLFQKIAASPVPVVCAIHGACAGGGFELALACHWRVADEAPETRIGLPETSIGAIPGWGGCVRLPRLIGASAALEHILKAQLLPASEALKTGLVDDVVPVSELRSRAKEAVLRLAASASGWAGLPARRSFPPLEPAAFVSHRQSVEARTRGREPAPLAAIETVERAGYLHVEEALELEARAFARVVAGEPCKNLIRAFFLRETAKKRTLQGWFQADQVKGTPQQAPITRVGIVGAGVMGSGIAHWLAANGLTVVLRDIKPEFVAQGLGMVRVFFDEAVRRGKFSAGDAEAALGRITTTTNWDGFDQCDLVIEAIVEDAAVKRALFTELAGVTRPDAILASNTSALPIEEIAGHVSRPERTLGIHFFNPVSRMPLIELVLARATSADVAERALALAKKLGKSPVVCRSSPGFLVTRVLFFYLNEAVRMWEQGVPTEAIDSALRDFGWPMGPLRLIDEVGVDVTDFIFGEMAHYFPSRFTATSTCRTLVAKGLRRRKNGTASGFYVYSKGRSDAEKPNGAVATVVPSHATPSGPTPSPREITDRLMGVMIAEARLCLQEGVVASEDDLDFAVLSGAGFPAFRGGLMRYAARISP